MRLPLLGTNGRTSPGRGRSPRGGSRLGATLSALGRGIAIGALWVASFAYADTDSLETTPPAGPSASTAKPARRAPPQYGSATLHLTAREPHGMPRRSDRVTIDCGDTTRVDTLFVSFEVPVKTPGLDSMAVTIYFHPLGGDTLGPFWHFKRGWENQMNLMVDFDRIAGVIGEMPWDVVGYGNVSYDHRSGRGRLDLAYTVPLQMTRVLEPGVTYTAARIRIRHRRADLGGCEQRVCVEASDLQLKFTTKRRISSGPGEGRSVGWNTDGPCAPPASAFKPWRRGS